MCKCLQRICEQVGRMPGVVLPPSFSWRGVFTPRTWRALPERRTGSACKHGHVAFVLRPHEHQDTHLDQVFEVREGYGSGDQPQQSWRAFQTFLGEELHFRSTSHGPVCVSENLRRLGVNFLFLRVTTCCWFPLVALVLPGNCVASWEFTSTIKSMVVVVQTGTRLPALQKM